MTTAQPLPIRRGPRPLLLHLMLAALKSNGLRAGSANWNSVWPLWSQGFWPRSAVAAGAAPDLAGSFAGAAEADRALIAGIAAYRRHPAQRPPDSWPILWREREITLCDVAPGAPGVPVLFVPSLINRGYILDLAEEWSLLRFLARNGVRPLLLDWGWPGPVERDFTLTDYIVGPLERAIDAVGEKLVLCGYCMGGLLATAAAQRRPDRVRGLGVLATPWDFRAHHPAQADLLAQLVPLLQPWLGFNGTLPIDLLQSLFVLLDPDAVAEKYRRFGSLHPDSARARRFVAIEDWANDCVPLAAPVARACFSDWYGANAPQRGTWRVAGMPAVPSSLTMPCFGAVPLTDRIVPPQSAMPLVEALPNATIVTPRSGHVSMIVGANAEAMLWRPLLDWLRAL